MAKQYQWRTVCDLVSPSGMSNGFTPTTYASWQTAGAGTASVNGIVYYYRDTNYTWTPAPDNNSSKANYVVNQSWVAEISELNVLKITLTTVITSVYRDDVRHQSYEGQLLPFPDTPCRDISVYDYTTADPTNPNDYGTYVDGFSDCEVAQAHTMYGQITFPTQVFYVQPSSGTAVIPIFIYNQTRGMPDRFDKVKIGVEFSNPLPAAVTYALRYNANGGSGAPAAQTVTTVDDNHAFTVSNTIPTRANYRFDGWSESPSGPALYHGGDTFTTYRGDPDKTLYAIWTPYWTATLTYDANGGTGAPAAQSASVNPDYTTKDFTVASGTPTWGHYKFLGWSTTRYIDSRTPSDVEYVAGDTFTIQKASPSRVLYAVWMMDYRPGATLDTNTSIWKSHNRADGACHVLSNTGNMTWQECRTIGGAEGDRGNPPLILTAPNANSWRNQKLLGKE